MIGLKTTQTAAAFMLAILLFAGMVGLAAAWSIDIDAEIEDASILISSSASTTCYSMSQDAWILDGSGAISVYGWGEECAGFVVQSIGDNPSCCGPRMVGKAEGESVGATMTLVGTLCTEECPPYETGYYAGQGVEVENGGANIFQAQGYCAYGGVAGQCQRASGYGESVSIYQGAATFSLGSEEVTITESHLMSAYGENVNFRTVGYQAIDVDDGMFGRQRTVFWY